MIVLPSYHPPATRWTQLPWLGGCISNFSLLPECPFLSKPHLQKGRAFPVGEDCSSVRWSDAVISPCNLSPPLRFRAHSWSSWRWADSRLGRGWGSRAFLFPWGFGTTSPFHPFHRRDVSPEVLPLSLLFLNSWSPEQSHLLCDSSSCPLGHSKCHFLMCLGLRGSARHTAASQQIPLK